MFKDASLFQYFWTHHKLHGFILRILNLLTCFLQVSIISIMFPLLNYIKTDGAIDLTSTIWVYINKTYQFFGLNIQMETLQVYVNAHKVMMKSVLKIGYAEFLVYLFTMYRLLPIIEPGTYVSNTTQRRL